MTTKLGTDIGRILLVGLYVLVFLVAGTMSGVGQGVSTGQSAYSGQSESSAQAYCVQMGYLYQITPTLNNGQPICKFTDTQWCDADAFYTGACTASYNPFGIPNPYATYYGYGNSQSVSVHTPYGDIPLGAAYGSGYIPVPIPTTESAQQAAWMYGAVSFLNAP